MPDTFPHTKDDTAELDALLSAEALTALMRSTWTWDDRALRRDLAALLVDLTAAQQMAATDTAPSSFAGALAGRAYADGSRLVATILGPKLIADTGNPLRPHYVDMATRGTVFTMRAHAAEQQATGDADDYVKKQIDSVEYAPEADWTALVRTDAAAGLGAAMRAAGHGLVNSSFFASIGLAWQAVANIQRCDEAAQLAQRLQAGEVVGTVAVAEQTGSWDPALVRTRAEKTDDGWRLTGEKNYVPAANNADVVLVIARSVAGPSLFAVDADATGLNITALDVTDASRPLFGVTLENTPATLLGTEGGGGRLMSQLIDRAVTALAAEQVGLIEAAIGALRDAGADADPRVTELVLTHAAAHACWQNALVDSSPEAAAAAHIACSGAAVRATDIVAEICGMSDVTMALLQRALSASLLFGGPALSHERLLERLGI